MQLLPLQNLHSPHTPTLPWGTGGPPQYQPAFKTPTPGSDRMIVPSSLTVADPTLTKVFKS